MKFFKKITIIILILTGASIASVFMIDYHISNSAKGFIYKDVGDLPEADAVLVLGASVYRSGRLSDILKDRALTAKDVFDSGKAEKIFISGDYDEGDYDEVVVTKKFLIEQGIAESAIETDLEGLDTFDSVKHAKEKLKFDSIIIATQDFHLPRALYLASKIGLKASGISADRQEYQRIEYFKWRERFANLKAFFDLLREP